MKVILARFNTNGARLFLKGLVTAWVPVAIIFDAVGWTPAQATLVMGASTYSVDGLFFMFGIGDKAPAPPAPPPSTPPSS